MSNEGWIALWVVVGIVTAIIAYNKGYTNWAAWFTIGFLFGPIGLIISLLIKKKPVNSSNSDNS